MNIFKYSFPPAFTDTILDVPEHSYPLTAQLSGNKLVVWFAQPEVLDANLIQFRVSVVPTGTNTLEGGTYLSTIQIPPLVYHIFYEQL